jgi:hypothetical protein
MKIYTDDPLLEYKTTRLNALYTRSEIDGIFAKYGIKDVFWHWSPDQNDVYVMFKIEEEIEGIKTVLSAKVEAYPIWDKRTRNKAETINWNVTMRQMHWFIKTHLQAAYVRQTSKAVAFLPYIISSDGTKVLHEIIIPHLADLEKLRALPEISNVEKEVGV